MLVRTLMAGLTAMVWLHAAAVGARAQLVDAPWPMFQHDNQHTGRSTLPGPTAPITIKWSYKGKNWIKTQPAVGPDGTVYFGSGRQPMCAVDPDTGAELWCNPKGGDANSSSPAIGMVNGSHRIYMGARDNKLWAVNPDGSVEWRYKIALDGDIDTSPAISSTDGTIYMTCGCLAQGIVWALDPDPPTAAGLPRWSLELGAGIKNSAPAIGENGRIYVGALDGRLFAIDDTPAGGVIAWDLSVGQRIRESAPTIHVGAGGVHTILVGTDSGLVAVRDDGTQGTQLWQRTTAGEVDTTPALTATGQIVVSSFLKGVRTLYAFDLNGNAVWDPKGGAAKGTTKRSQSASAVIDSNGIVYQALGKWVYALAFNGTAVPTEVWKVKLPADVITMSLGNGVLYVSARDSMLYALE